MQIVFTETDDVCVRGVTTHTVACDEWVKMLMWLGNKLQDKPVDLAITFDPKE